MSSDDYKIPELPSDEELGIAGLSEDDLPDDTPPARTPPPPPGSAGPGRTGPPPPPRSRWRGPATLAFLMAAAWAVSGGRSMPAPSPANAPDTAFSSGRAMATLVTLARAPHPVGSPEHQRVRQVIEERLQELGLDPEVQTTTSVIRRGETARAATVRNLVARIPGTASSGALLLTAHYDAVPLSSGAGDDGTGVVTILETVRALQAGPALRNDVIVLITDAEELGLLGARAFVAEHPWMADVQVVLSVEMRGGGGPSIMFETGADNGWIVQAFGRSAPFPLANAASVEIYRRLPNDTDFSPFRDAGVQGLNFAAIDRAEVYHQAADVPGNIQEATLQHHGANLLAVTRYLGDADLSQVDAPDRAYLSLPVLGVVSYPRSWSLAAAGVLVVLALVALLLVRARGGSLAGVGTGVLLAVVATALTAGAGWGLFRWVRAFHPEYGSLVPAFYEEGWYMLALVALGLASVTALYGLVRRRFAPGALALGAALLPLGGAVALGFVAPLAAPNLQWPVAAALVMAALAGTLIRPGGEAGVAVWVLSLVLALPVLAVLVPLTEFVWVAMSISLAPYLGALVVLGLLLVLPALDGLGHPNRWWAPAAALVLATLFTGTGVLRAGAAPDRPAPSTLLYLLDRDAGTSRWATRDGAGAAWARERTGTPLDTEADLDAFRRPGSWQVSPAPAVDAAPPAVTVRSDTTLADRRHLVLDVAAPLEAEALTVQLASDGPWRVTGVNGQGIPEGEAGDGQGVTMLEHWGIPADTLRITLEAPAGVQAPRFHILEQFLRPGELVGAEAFMRPDTLMPQAPSGSDRALIRTPVALEPGPPTVRTDSTAAPAPDTARLRPPPDTVRDTLGR